MRVIAASWVQLRVVPAFGGGMVKLQMGPVRHVSTRGSLKNYHQDQVVVLILSFFWLALRTLTFWVSI